APPGGKNRGSSLTLSLRTPKCRLPIPGHLKKFNLISTLSAPLGRAPQFRKGRKALTVRSAPSIRPAMAAGAILPPLFFERCCDVSHFAPGTAFAGNKFQQSQPRSCGGTA